MKNSIGIEFGIKLKAIRQKKDLSQQELAEIADLDRSYISQLEGGRLIPSLTTLTKLASSLDVAVAELVDFNVKEHQEKITQSRDSTRPSANEIFGEILRNLREAQGLSQTQLADLSGIDRTFISRIERGMINVTISAIFKLSKALNTNASDIIRIFEEKI